MIIIRRANMCPNTPAEQQLLYMYRKRFETRNSEFEKMCVVRLHARLSIGVSLKRMVELCVLNVPIFL